jgi:UDP-N-acetylmuramyl pentapeptide phosphotransferase/UDP-N-acetylglucosamine-1-phosphate transferase
MLPIIALLSMYAFQCVNWTTKNYEGKRIPYSLGVFVIFSYAVLCAFPPIDSYAFSYVALIYVLGIWLIGFLDDRFGQVHPKGIRGHFDYFLKKGKLTTGLIKVIGTLVIASFFTLYYEPANVMVSLSCFLLLTWMPHLANLFDTRPLRVWKMALLFSMVLILIVAIPPFLTIIYLFVVFYILFVLEGHRKAMLGDSGATTIGAILAVMTVIHTDLIFQWAVLSVVFTLIMISERVSFSSFIEKTSFLRWFDQLGISSKK